MCFRPSWCALECAFCSTGRQGFNRNLTVAEIVGQLWFASKILDSKRIFLVPRFRKMSFDQLVTS